MRDPTDLRGEEQREQEANLTRQFSRRQEVEDFKWMAAHKQGRRLLWRLLSMSGQLKSSMTGNSQTFFNEGARAFGLVLMDEFHQHSIEAYVQMVKENSVERSE